VFYPQNGNRIETTDSVTSPPYVQRKIIAEICETTHHWNGDVRGLGGRHLLTFSLAHQLWRRLIPSCRRIADVEWASVARRTLLLAVIAVKKSPRIRQNLLREKKMGVTRRNFRHWPLAGMLNLAVFSQCRLICSQRPCFASLPATVTHFFLRQLSVILYSFIYLHFSYRFRSKFIFWNHCFH